MKFIAALLFSLTLAFTAFAQSPSKILKQAEKALGGQKALKAMTSVYRTGRIVRVSDGAEGKYLHQTSQPNLFNVSYDLAGFETETGYNGRSGWLRDSRNGLQTITGDASTAMQAKAAYRDHLWLKAKDEKSKIVAGGQMIVNGKSANSIIINTPKGISIKVYFDAATGLPVRDEIPNGSSVDVTEYSDYRSVNGVQQAFAHGITIGTENYEVKFDDVRTNQQIAKAEFDFPNISGEPLPDIPTLLKDLQANEDRVETLLDSYSFTQKVTKRELGKDGNLRETESETTQLSFYKGSRIERVIEKNGRPLSANDQEKADRDAAKQVEEIEKKIAKEDARKVKQNVNGTPSDENRRISIAEVLRASKLLNPRRERFRGRDCVVFDFEPNPAFDMKNAKSMLKFFGKTAGVMWIDEKDKQVARLEAVLFENYNVGGGVLAKLKKGATFMLEKERVGDEIWLPSQTDINLSVRVLLVKGIDVNQVIKSYDYRKFETEVKDATVDGTKKP
jgi:hypothetical protein